MVKTLSFNRELYDRHAIQQSILVYDEHGCFVLTENSTHYLLTIDEFSDPCLPDEMMNAILMMTIENRFSQKAVG